MSLLRASLSCVPLTFALACAASPKSVEAPRCDEPEKTIVVSDPAVSAPVAIIPREPELVSMRLFVVSATGQGIDEGLPEAIRSSPTCASGGCTLLLSPLFLGRSGGEMELEVGTGRDQNLFSLQARPRLSKDHVELDLQARFEVRNDAERPPTHQLRFEGLLELGQITHVGTFHDEDPRVHAVGPQVFVMAEAATAQQG